MRRSFTCTFCVGVTLLAGTAGAQTKTFAAPPVLKADIDDFPTSRSLLAASQAIIKSGQDESSLRATGGLAQRSTFRLGGELVPVLGNGASAIPRLAMSPGRGGVAFIIRLPLLPKGVGYQNPTGDPQYALASIEGRTARVWAYLSTLPPDDGVARRMLRVLAHLEAPLSSFELPASARYGGR